MAPSSTSSASTALTRPHPTTVPTPSAPVQAPLTLLESFACGGLAGCAAVTVSNVPEVAKTRMQLQGELQKVNSNAPRVYKNAIDVLFKTWKHEGIRGMQRGLFPAYGYQMLLNGSRLGLYDPIRKTINGALGVDPKKGNALTAVTSGAITGCIGAGLGSPLFLVKARIQAYSPALPVGAQHNYKGAIDAMRTIMRKDGVRGLWRGVDAAMLRTAMASDRSDQGTKLTRQGSAVQVPSYNMGKSFIVDNGLGKADSFSTYFLASAVAGICTCAAMQPADTVLTRTYNQHTEVDPVTGKVRGKLYSGPLDCLWKTYKAEGIPGWYKGTTAHLLRIWPHTVITLVANEIILAQYRKVRHEPKLA